MCHEAKITHTVPQLNTFIIIIIFDTNISLTLDRNPF